LVGGMAALGALAVVFKGVARALQLVAAVMRCGVIFGPHVKGAAITPAAGLMHFVATPSLHEF
jgi:hypothetical protein